MARLPLILAAFLLLAASPDPTGHFDLAVSGREVTVTLSDLTHLTKNDEVTLGTICFRADGSQIPMGNRSNPYIFEVNWFGRYVPVTFSVPDDAVICQSQLIAADWFKGEVMRAWVLQPWVTFEVPA